MLKTQLVCKSQAYQIKFEITNLWTKDLITYTMPNSSDFNSQ